MKFRNGRLHPVVGFTEVVLPEWVFILITTAQACLMCKSEGQKLTTKTIEYRKKIGGGSTYAGSS